MKSGMDCRKTQRLIDELAEGRLTAPLAEQLRRHLTDCTDCRVAEQRAARLRRLLALKRYEQPAPEYFHGFLDEFHRRLQVETVSHASLWMRLKMRWEDLRATPPVWVLRYGLSGAAAVLLVTGVALWMSTNRTAPLASQNAKANTSQAGGSPGTVVQNGATAFVPLAGDLPTGTTTRVVLVNPTAHVETGMPRYVLDHIAITPASYEGPRIDF